MTRVLAPHNHRPSTAASPAQHRMIKALISEIALLDREKAVQLWEVAKTADQAGKLTGGREGSASTMIDKLIQIKRAVQAPAPVIPAKPANPQVSWGAVREAFDALDLKGSRGIVRVALTLPTEDKLRFFKITKGRSRYFVSEQAGPTDYPVTTSARQLALAQALKGQVDEAMARYGQELGHCGRCGLALTDEVSRGRGIGPDCWGKI